MKISKTFLSIAAAFAGCVFQANTLEASPLTLAYSLTGGGNTISFSLNVNPTLTGLPDYSSFATTPTDLMINGSAASFTNDAIYFYTTQTGGGLELVAGTYDFDLHGNQLFAGTTYQPTLLMQPTLTLKNLSNVPYTVQTSLPFLTIVPLGPLAPSSAAPEPSTFAVFGLALTGFGARLVRRRSK